MIYKTLLISIIILQTTIFSQIPNNSFEEWSNGNPVGWLGNNYISQNITTITPTDISHSGLKAVKGEVIQLPIPMAPFLILGNEGKGIPYSQRPVALTGYYQFFPQSGDRFQILAGLFKGGFEINNGSLGISGKLIGYAIQTSSEQVTSYTKFLIPIMYISNEEPDTCGILFRIIGTTSDFDFHVGSYFLLDDVEFLNTTNIEEKQLRPYKFELMQNYPNPFNATTKILYKIPVQGFVTIKVYDMLGKEITVLVNEEKPAGTHSINFDASGLTSGSYVYTLYYNNFLQSKKMLLIK